MRFGSLELATNLCLSPLAGYTNLPFRLTLRELGGLGLATTDLVNARSLLERRPKALKLVESREADRPLAVQLFGAVPEEMRDAAVILEGMGVASVDINMGCPVRKVCKVGGGSAMMNDLDRTVHLVRGMVEAVKIPVTVKMRLGWDEENLTAPDLARAVADAGVAAVFVHGRTRQQGFSGRVSLDGIRAVVEAAPGIPVIGNGDVTTPQAAKRMFEETGCAGVSVGRGAFYNPWIFCQTEHYLRTGEELEEPEFGERLRVMTLHLDRMVEVFGEDLGCRMFRKVAPWYARRFGPSSYFNKRVVRLATRADFDEIVAGYQDWREQFEDGTGQLQSRYAPAPLAVAFKEDGEEADAGMRVAVPKGPVELW
jgi:nifR3 family TIM-barrel protein